MACRRHSLRGALLLAAALSAPVAGDIPISGYYQPALKSFDDEMVEFMTENDIESGVLGVMRNGCMVYLRGFGYWNGDTKLPENALFRLASCTKPITAAAIRSLISRGFIELDDHVFDLDQPGGGILNYTPFGGLGDSRLEDVTVDHCLRHRGGWDDSETGVDWTYIERDIADDMGVDSPPGRVNTVRWILGQPLQDTPGAEYSYANIGYLVLGLIVEQESGTSLEGYHQKYILTPNHWVSNTELEDGRTFKEWGNPREPWYRNSGTGRNVFDNHGPEYVTRAYGGWDHEARIGQGGILATAATMLTFAETYHVGVTNNIGRPRSEVALSGTESHNGSLGGVNTKIWQRDDGINVFVAFNSRPDDGNYADMFVDRLTPLFDDVGWPGGPCLGGFWVRLDLENFNGVGGYHNPFNGFEAAIASTGPGAVFHLKPGASDWAGKVTEKSRITAPLGTAKLGE